jgi:hypothetical protein
MINITISRMQDMYIEVAASIRPKDGNYVEIHMSGVDLTIYCGSPESAVVLGRALADSLASDDLPVDLEMYGEFIRAHPNELLIVPRSEPRVKPQVYGSTTGPGEDTE